MEAGLLRVGAARVDITPPLSVPYLGFHPRQALFGGVHDPLEARAAVFRGETGDACIVSMDALGMDNRMLGPGRHFTTELRELVRKRCGIGPRDTMVCSTHAHSTPETLGITRSWELPAVQDWMEHLLQRLAALVAAADAAAAPCTLKAARGNVLGVGHNRRPRARGLSLEEQVARGLLDPELGLLLCEDGSSAARCVLLSYACHAVTMQVQPLVSADYPGVACRLVEERLPGRPVCLFLQGAAGDINPVRDDSRDFRDVELHGLAVGGEALKQAALLAGDRSAAFESAVVRGATASVELPPRELPRREEVVERHVLAKARALSSNSEGGKEAATELRAASEALDLLDRFSTSQETEVQALRIGELAVAASAGEMFTTWGLEIKSSSPAAQTFVVELANGWAGYLLGPGGFEEGGYETGLGTWTQTSEQGGRAVTRRMEELLRGLWS